MSPSCSDKKYPSHIGYQAGLDIQASGTPCPIQTDTPGYHYVAITNNRTDPIHKILISVAVDGDLTIEEGGAPDVFVFPLHLELKNGPSLSVRCRIMSGLQDPAHRSTHTVIQFYSDTQKYGVGQFSDPPTQTELFYTL